MLNNTHVYCVEAPTFTPDTGLETVGKTKGNEGSTILQNCVFSELDNLLLKLNALFVYVFASLCWTQKVDHILRKQTSVVSKPRCTVVVFELTRVAPIVLICCHGSILTLQGNAIVANSGD